MGNETIAELLARKAEETPQPAQRAIRRAARRVFLWEVEDEELAQQGTSLTQLSGVGPYIEKMIRQWLEHPPLSIVPSSIRSDFVTLCQARRVLSRKPSWIRRVKGDLQMETTWSDGGGTIEEMSGAARERTTSSSPSPIT